MDYYEPSKLVTTFQVVIPVAFGIIICIVLCRCFYKCRATDAQEELRPRAHLRSSAVYNIPISEPEEQPQYEDDLEEQYPPPPSYNELTPKLDLPSTPPPDYTEFISPSFTFPIPDEISPSES
ncbi:uncharacterized protein Hap1MRO34_018779 [Clarias gariepinus]